MANRGGTILAYPSGERINVFKLKPKDIYLEDIAHALSNICRYNGHVSKHYSVAQHSCLLHDYGDEDIKDQLIIHDGPEAYLGDLVSPLKHLPQFAFYRNLEDSVWEVFAERFDLPSELDTRVHELDKAIRKREMFDLKDYTGDCGLGKKNRYADFHFDQIHPWTALRAEDEFLRRAKKAGLT